MKHTIDNYSQQDFIIHSKGILLTEQEQAREDGLFKFKYNVSVITVYHDNVSINISKNDIYDLYNKIQEIEQETYLDYPEY